MRRWVGALGLGLALGAGGALVGIAALSTSDAHADPPKAGWPADPPAVAATKQWVFEVRSVDSVPYVMKVNELELPKAEPTQRVMGRWALEFYVGTELLDRLRFNVPLTGDGPSDKKEPGKKRPEIRVNTRFFLRMADQKRATYVRIVDRMTGDIRLYDWPPTKDGRLLPRQQTAPAASASASASAAPSAAPDAGAPPPKDGGDKDAGRFTPEKP